MWWKRFKPNRSTLPAALLATALCGACLLLIWTPPQSPEGQIKRYGDALAQTLAHSNAGLMLHQQRIELAVIANQVSQLDEVDGVAFYSASNEIIALAGSTDRHTHFTAPATLDDTITGYVTLIVDPAAFAPPSRGLAWLLSLLAMAAAPLASLGVMQLSARGNRSLPIVSVPETPDAVPQQSFCLVVNLYNQLALSGTQRRQAIVDAVDMATEACAIHHGFTTELGERGVALLFDRDSVNAGQALCAAFLLQRLLSEFETEGAFRYFLTEALSPDSPTELVSLPVNALEESLDLDSAMTTAALARSGSVVLAPQVFELLSENEKAWARPFDHPLITDLNDNAESPSPYLVSELPEPQAQLVANQADLVLGFN